MPYKEQTRSSGPKGVHHASPEVTTSLPSSSKERNGQPKRFTKHAQASTILHGEALARDPWAERSGSWIVLGFVSAFALLLIIMIFAGQTPGKSSILKSSSEILQFVGEAIGAIFCVRIADRLRKATRRLRQELNEKELVGHSQSQLAALRREIQLARRAFLAWTFLTLAVASYATGQAIWASYDMLLNPADIPLPGAYNICFVMSYPFFLLGTLLLIRHHKSIVGRTRLVLLDALGIISTALALSWFFLLSPLIASLARFPNWDTAFLSIYFPTGDLFLVAVGTIVMFSPLSQRDQQPVFLRLCLGLFFLAITDSLLAYHRLLFNFNTGSLQDVLWPLSMLLIGLAAIEYPHSVAREQEQKAQANNAVSPSRANASQLTTTLQTIAPLILILTTCTVLLTIVAPTGGDVLIQADIVALGLILIVVARQALTLLENNRLTMQIRGELVISRRELQLTRRDADEATRTAQEKRVLEEGVAVLREIHARVARGDFSARAPTVPGPLLPIAISFNLMLDRLSAMSQRVSMYNQLVQEGRLLQSAVERLAQGLPAWSPNQPAPQSNTELRPVFLALMHMQRYQEGQWRRVVSITEPMSNLTRRLHETLAEVRQSHLFAEGGSANFERMLLDRVLREADLLEQQQRNLLSHSTISMHNSPPSGTSSEQLMPPPSTQHAHHLAPSYTEQKHTSQTALHKLVPPLITDQAKKPYQSNASTQAQSNGQSQRSYANIDSNRNNSLYRALNKSTEDL
ncbi:MAG: hypothetical protein E6J34_12080 [Chloroflexi bacterium]|nr:MAG: hypothetical protein E6J34_12080 [Chloroflexota bacterium]